ncbi:MAG: hypothetical protein HZC22_13260 [Rhodocyclales bacterium]|nr:hypothetical protein [Rhodocyclales bacterium]
MIIASINNQEFILESQKDAEQLLAIMSRATAVDHNYRGESYETYYYPDHTAEISIKITSANLVSIEEHQRNVEAKNAAKAEQGAAA